MGRGIVGGLIWGMIVSGVILAAVSLSLPLPERAETGQPAPTAANDPVPEPQLAPLPSDAPFDLLIRRDHPLPPGASWLSP